jgi:multidrug efflux pump subunit AcrA (membrane-fusion protein)
VVVGRRDSAVLVPRAAVREGTVWVVDAQGLAHQRAVRLGLEGSDAVEVLEGVAEGDRVVVSGASLLSEGVQTRIVGG